MRKFQPFFLAGAAVVGGSGTALTAPVISRTSGVTTYPVTVDIARQPDWVDGDKLVTRWSTDPTFATSTEGAPVTLAAATTTITVGISAIVSGTYYIQSAAYRNSRPGSLNWSNIVGVGNTTTPTISSTNTGSGYQFVSGTKALTASKSGYWAIVGGAYQAQFAISGNTLAWDAQTGTPAMDVQVQFTDYFGNPSAAQTITVTIAANTPDAFTFTDVTNSSLSTQYTSNTITLGGAAPGPYPISITGGTYSKNGGAYTSAAGTAVPTDTIAIRCTSPAGNNGTTTVVFTAGVTSDTWTVSSPVALTTTTTWNPSDKAASVTLSNTGGTNMTASGTVNGTNASARTTTGKSTGKRYAEISAAMFNGVGLVGISDGSESMSNYAGQTTHSTGYKNDGTLTNCNTGSGTAYNDNNNHTIGLAIDCDAGTVDYYLDNVLQGHGPNGGNPAISAPLYIIFTAVWTSTSATLNTGHSAWVYGPPTGYEAWDV